MATCRKYEIAEYFPREVLEVAVKAVYNGNVQGISPRTYAEECPMGICLSNMPGAVGWYYSPFSWEVADVLVGESDVRHTLVSLAARDFIDDWDNGRIPPEDLPIALGLVEDDGGDN